MATLKIVKHDSRICFGLEYYATEEEAEKRAKQVRKLGYTYNGGFFDGMPCGREKQFDHDDPKHGRLYAVST